ncbi:MAG: homoserine/homoserine lactone efflux protein [Chthoniobacterales bacterium]
MLFPAWLAFLTASIIISVSPGAGAVASMTSGLNRGLLRSYWVIVGLQLGLLFQVAAVGFGVGAFIVQSEIAFQIIKWFGVAYLVWLGIRCWNSKDSRELSAKETEGQSVTHQITHAIIVNITNPKAYVFMIAILPQFINPAKSVFIQFSIMALPMVVVDVIVMSGYALFASQLARFFKDPRHLSLLNKLFGTLFLLVAFVLTWVRRAA